MLLIQLLGVLKETTQVKNLALCLVHGGISIHLTHVVSRWDFPDDLAGEESACNAGDTGDAGQIPESGRSPGEGNGKNTPVFLPKKYHGEQSLVGYGPMGCKALDTTEQLNTSTVIVLKILVFSSVSSIQQQHFMWRGTYTEKGEMRSLGGSVF